MPKYINADKAELKVAEYYTREILKIARRDLKGPVADEIELCAMIAVSTLKSEIDQRGR